MLRKLLPALLFTGIVANTMHPPGQAADYKMHCLYLYKFSQLITWPYKKEGEFVIGVAGNSLLIPTLEQYIISKNKSAVVKYRLLKFSSVQTITDCDLLYVTSDQLGSFNAIIKKTTGKPTLIISEVPGLIRRGSCINLLYDEGSSIKIQVNKAAIESRELKVSSDLFKLAAEVL